MSEFLVEFEEWLPKMDTDIVCTNTIEPSPKTTEVLNPPKSKPETSAFSKSRWLLGNLLEAHHQRAIAGVVAHAETRQDVQRPKAQGDARHQREEHVGSQGKSRVHGDHDQVIEKNENLRVS